MSTNQLQGNLIGYVIFMYATYVSALQLTQEPTRKAFHVCSVILFCERA